MKLLLVALALAFATLRLAAASDNTLQEANDAYTADRHEDVVRLFTLLLDREPAPAASDAAVFHYKRAYSLFRLKRIEEARTDLFDALELGHETADTYNLLGLVYSEKGEPDMGVEYAQKAVEAARKTLDLRSQKRRTDFATYAENLIACSQEFAARDPAFVRGDEAFTAGRHSDAKTALDHALAAYPTGAHELACRLRRGLALLELSEPLEALHNLQRVIELGGESASVLNALGRAYSGLGNDIAAYDHFYNAVLLATERADRKAARENVAATSRKLSAQADVLHAQAQAALRRDDASAAHALYARAMLLPGGRSTDFLASLVASSDRAISAFDAEIAPLDKLSRTGTPESILAEFQRLKQLYPLSTRLDFLRDDAFFTLLQTKYPKSYTLLGKARNVPYGEWKKAIKHLNEAIKLAPDIPALYLDRAAYLSKLKDPKALQDLDTAVRLLGGETHRTHSCRGEFYRNTGGTARAFEHLQAALKLNPNARDSWESWTREFFDAQEKNPSPQAKTDAPTDRRSARQRAFDLAQTSPGSEASDLYVGLAQTDHNMNEGFLIDYSEVNRAASDYSWAIILDPLNGDAYCGRAYCYDRVNDLNAALADFTRAKNVGYSSGSEGIGMIWRKKASASIDAYLKNGGNSSTASSGTTSSPQPSASRYCMRCSATGSIYVYEDDTDAYNHRVRVEKKKSCPECGGRGVR